MPAGGVMAFNRILAEMVAADWAAGLWPPPGPSDVKRASCGSREGA